MSHCMDRSQKIWISPGCQYFVDICSSFTQPPMCVVYKIIFPDSTKLPTAVPIFNVTSRNFIQPAIQSIDPEKMELDLESLKKQAHLYEATFVDSTKKTVPQLFQYQSAHSGKTHFALLFRPLTWKPGVKYATILYVYGGPNVQLVRQMYYGNRLGFQDFTQLLEYCVVVVDGRGSDNRGLEFEFAIKHQMGQVEVLDQVEGLLHVANETNCIDLSRIAVSGWSYGGYLSLRFICQRPELFKVAISGAPVTEWPLYDTAYTERYMGLPTTNAQGYQDGSVVAQANRFPNEANRLLILHGLNDENVHFSHTAALISALIHAGKPYQMQVYPSERHAARGSDSSEHMDCAVLHFLQEHL